MEVAHGGSIVKERAANRVANVSWGHAVKCEGYPKPPA